jgi:hypothetical protein
MVKRDLVRDMGEFSFIEQLILNYQTRNQRMRWSRCAVRENACHRRRSLLDAAKDGEWWLIQ